MRTGHLTSVQPAERAKRFHEARIAHENAQRSNPKNRTYNLEYLHLYSGDFARAEEAATALLNEAPTALEALCYGPQPPLMAGNLTLAEQRLAAGLAASGRAVDH